MISFFSFVATHSGGGATAGVTAVATTEDTVGIMEATEVTEAQEDTEPTVKDMELIDLPTTMDTADIVVDTADSDLATATTRT